MLANRHHLRSKLLAAMALTFAITAPLLAQLPPNHINDFTGTVRTQQGGTVNRTLVDPQGATVSNAHIELRWNYVSPGKQKPRRKTSLQVTTDGAGRFSASLAPGNWDVFAYSDGFAPTCTIVLVESGKTTAVDLRFPNYAPMALDKGARVRPSDNQPGHQP
ncbi:MAG TPA: carboxypeptidase-like regulatory domain-containing protein [Candidatus Eisenbacteria bacterium]|nr:carboxypeptidase-like regulatory domain-containing protein [Candidatus Eisenbacteria bacterium]